MILGAGASYDYCFDEMKNENNSLPLSNELFSKRFYAKQHFYPGAKSMASLIKPDILKYLDEKYNVNSSRILSQLLNKANIDYDIINENLNEHFELMVNDEVIHAAADDYKQNILYLPQLLLPIKLKDEFIMPEKSLNLMEYFLKDIVEILVIGWKGTEARFQKLLAQTLKDTKIAVTVVTLNDRTAVNELSKSLPASTFNFTGNTFAQYMKHCATNSKHFFSPEI